MSTDPGYYDRQELRRDVGWLKGQVEQLRNRIQGEQDYRRDVQHQLNELRKELERCQTKQD